MSFESTVGSHQCVSDIAKANHDHVAAAKKSNGRVFKKLGRISGATIAKIVWAALVIITAIVLAPFTCCTSLLLIPLFAFPWADACHHRHYHWHGCCHYHGW